MESVTFKVKQTVTNHRIKRKFIVVANDGQVYVFSWASFKPQLLNWGELFEEDLSRKLVKCYFSVWRRARLALWSFCQGVSSLSTERYHSLKFMFILYCSMCFFKFCAAVDNLVSCDLRSVILFSWEHPQARTKWNLQIEKMKQVNQSGET